VKFKVFGNTELRVSELGFGCARIGGIFAGGPGQAGGSFVDLIHAAYDNGINFFDTADMYSQGESESLLGKAFRGRRERVVIASKVGYVLPGRRRLIARIKPLVRPIVRTLKIKRDKLPSGMRGTVTQDFSPVYLERAVEGSLRRLRTDYIDVLQLHSPPADVIRQGSWQAALDRLKSSGKVRYYGIAVDSIEAGQAALAFPIASLQFVLNLLEPGAADALVPLARERGVAYIARECLANGLLVKDAATLDWSKYCATPAERERRVRQLDEVRARAAAQRRALPAFALDYVTSLSGVSVALVGASNEAQLTHVLAQVFDTRAA